MKLSFKTVSPEEKPDDHSKDEKAEASEVQNPTDTVEENKEFLPKEPAYREFFGVRSYLHNFYESVSIRNPQLYEDIYEDEMLYFNRGKKQNKVALFCWKFNLAIGAFTLALGITFILVGYLTPLHEGIAAHQKEFVIIDRESAKFNYYIKLCRIIGLIIFCIGGCIFFFTLLLSLVFNIHNTDDDEESSEPLYVAYTIENAPPNSNDKKIPATEEVTSVQPKREVEEVVMTKSGLCQASTLNSLSTK